MLVTTIVQVSFAPGAAVSRSTVLVIAIPLGNTSAVVVSRGFDPTVGHRSRSRCWRSLPPAPLQYRCSCSAHRSGRLPTVQVQSSTRGSATATLLRSTSPVLTTVIVNVTSEPIGETRRRRSCRSGWRSPAPSRYGVRHLDGAGRAGDGRLAGETFSQFRGGALDDCCGSHREVSDRPRTVRVCRVGDDDIGQVDVPTVGGGRRSTTPCRGQGRPGTPSSTSADAGAESCSSPVARTIAWPLRYWSAVSSGWAQRAGPGSAGASHQGFEVLHSFRPADR